jgi:uncharacterized protein
MRLMHPSSTGSRPVSMDIGHSHKKTLIADAMRVELGHYAALILGRRNICGTSFGYSAPTGDIMIALLANLGIYLAIVLLLVSPALFRKQTRGWAIVVIIVVLGDLIALFGGGSYQHAVFGHAWHYNWMGKGFSLAFGLIVAIILIASRKFRSRELGLSFLQAPGTGRALLTVVLPFLILLVVLAAMSRGSKDHSLETLLFQATMPGLTEELFFRGILLALFDRMFAARFRVFGAELSYGAIATSLMFGLGHVVTFHAKGIPHVDIGHGIMTTVVALLLVWIRCRSRSLVLPVVLHNLGNTIHLIVPRLI